MQHGPRGTADNQLHRNLNIHTNHIPYIHSHNHTYYMVYEGYVFIFFMKNKFLLPILLYTPKMMNE